MKRKCVKLEDGRYLLNDFGKYRPNLCLILRNETDTEAWEPTHANNFNLEGRKMNALRGKYWKSKKGTDCFELLREGPHLLLRESWGGGGDRGDLKNLSEFIYFRRAASNGGGEGYTYAIVEVEWRRQISVDEL